MEYITAMNFEVDNVIPVREPQVSNLFVSQKSLNEAEYDDFIDDVNREMTGSSVLTELRTLPLLIRRNSSTGKFNVSSNGKENIDQASMVLSRADTLTLGTNCGVSEANRDISLSRNDSVLRNDGSDRNTLHTLVLSPGCSLERSLTVVNNCDENISFRMERSVYSQDKEDRTLDDNNENRDLEDSQVRLKKPGENVDLFPVSNNCYCPKDLRSNIIGVTEPNSSLAAAVAFPDDNDLCSSRTLSISSSINRVEEVSSNSVNENQALETSPQQDVIYTTKSPRKDNFLDLSVVEEVSRRVVLAWEEVIAMTRGSSSPSPIHEDVLPDKQTLSASHEKITKKRGRSPSSTKSDKPRKINKITAPDNSDLNQRRSENQDGVSGTNRLNLKKYSAFPIKESMTDHDHFQISPFLMETPKKKINMESRPWPSPSSVQKSKKSPVVTRRSVSRLTSRYPNRSAAHIFQSKVKIFKAVEEGNLEFVRNLINNTGPAIRKGKKDSTLLHTAASSNQSDLLIYLLKVINPNIINKDGQTPAHVAAVHGHTQILKILMADKDFNPNKQDKMGRTFKDLLLGPLFEAVLDGDKNKTRILLQLGADLDCHAGKSVEGILSRELNVTSARHLSQTLHGDDFLKGLKMNKTDSSTCQEIGTPLHFHKFFCGKWYSTKIGAPVQNTRGYACILNFKSFTGKPELERKTSNFECQKLTKVFEGMGFSGHLHTSLTAEQVKTTFQSDDTKKMLNNAKCAVFVISSHSINKESFLTSDMRCLTTDWVMDFFKDSECPQLKFKPKIFIFDFQSGFYIKKMTLKPEPQPMRMGEPRHNMMCIASENNSFYNYPSQNHSFMKALCQTLQKGSKLTVLEMYRHLLKECSNEHLVSFPELQNFSFPENFSLSQITIARR